MPGSDMNVLVLNSGSSSQKSCLYRIGARVPDVPPAPVWEGKTEWVGEVATSSVRNSGGVEHTEQMPAGSRAEAVERLLGTLWSGDTQAVSGPDAIDCHTPTTRGSEKSFPRSQLARVSAEETLHHAGAALRIPTHCLSAVDRLDELSRRVHAEPPQGFGFLTPNT